MLLHRTQEEQRVSLFSGMALATAVALGMAVLLRETADVRAALGIAISDSLSMAALLAGMLLLVLAVEARRLFFRSRFWPGPGHQLSALSAARGIGADCLCGAGCTDGRRPAVCGRDSGCDGAVDTHLVVV